MSERENPFTAALRYVFGPLVEQSTRWPAPLAYGLAAIVSVLLITVVRSTLPSNMAWLLTMAVLFPLAGFLISDWSARRFARALIITGNVLTDGGFPVKGAVVFVDGVDRKKETDETGWFQIAVEARPSWTVRARYGDHAVQRTVSGEEAMHAVVLTVPAAAAAAAPPPKPPEHDTVSRVRLVPGSSGTPFESSHRLTTVGRSPKSTMRLDDATVSWEHAQIILMSDGYHYRHVGSNPTLLRRRGEEWELSTDGRDDIVLHNGDRLTIGAATYVVELDLAAADASPGYIATEDVP